MTNYNAYLEWHVGNMDALVRLCEATPDCKKAAMGGVATSLEPLEPVRVYCRSHWIELLGHFPKRGVVKSYRFLTDEAAANADHIEASRVACIRRADEIGNGCEACGCPGC